MFHRPYVARLAPRGAAATSRPRNQALAAPRRAPLTRYAQRHVCRRAARSACHAFDVRRLVRAAGRIRLPSLARASTPPLRQKSSALASPDFPWSPAARWESACFASSVSIAANSQSAFDLFAACARVATCSLRGATCSRAAVATFVHVYQSRGNWQLPSSPPSFLLGRRRLQVRVSPLEFPEFFKTRRQHALLARLSPRRRVVVRPAVRCCHGTHVHRGWASAGRRPGHELLPGRGAPCICHSTLAVRWRIEIAPPRVPPLRPRRGFSLARLHAPAWLKESSFAPPPR